jgi:molybdate transport system substrate-binding protein
MSRRAALSILVVGLCLAAGCRERGKNELVVFAAASLDGAFSELVVHFEAAHPEGTVAMHFAGTQELRTQIEHGARADVLAAADTRHMTALVDARAMAAPVLFARNEPVIVVAKDTQATVASLADLANVPRLVVGGPEVPIGRYTEQILARADAAAPGQKAAIEARIVSRELNVRQVLTKVSLGEADAGIVYRTDAIAAGDEVTVVDIPAAVNVVAEYPIAVATGARDPALAAAFAAFVTSPAGQDILRRHGFSVAARETRAGASATP